MIELASQESGQIISDFKNAPNPGDHVFLQNLEMKSEELVLNHFIVVEMYDGDKGKILEKVRSDKDAVENVLKRYSHQFPTNFKPLYNKFYIDKVLYLQVIVPIMDNARLHGYFEGVYQVDNATMSDIYGKITWSLSQTVAVVFLTTIMLYPIIMALNRDLVKQSQELLSANIDLLEVLGGAVAKRDSDTNVHNYRVTIYAVKLAEASKLDADEIKNLIKGAFLHDVGKIGISDQILLKPGKLNDDEMKEMRKHVRHGVDIVKKSGWLKSAFDVVEYHHEKYDGSGYLKGIRGYEIPVAARIFAIADVFDALTSRRPYKEPFSFGKTMEILREGKGAHFDPELIDSFERIAEELYTEVNAASEEKIEDIFKMMIKKYFFDQPN